MQQLFCVPRFVVQCGLSVCIHQRKKRSLQVWVEAWEQTLLLGEELFHPVALFWLLKACLLDNVQRCVIVDGEPRTADGVSLSNLRGSSR